MMSSLTHHARNMRLDTLIRLRWLAVTGQSIAVLGVHFGFGFSLPFTLCLGVIAVAALLNLVLRLVYPVTHRLSDRAAVCVLAFDILQLACLLYLTGGLQNPFAILFLAPVLVSATALPPLHILALGLLAALCATFVALYHWPLPWLDQNLSFHPLYLSGIWVSILLGIGFTGIYAWRVAEEARQLTQALTATEIVLAREQHLSQLDGLAAAAAHELGTPLATIALVVKEMSHHFKDNPLFADDMILLREQVERCRTILTTLTSFSHADEQNLFFEKLTVSHLLEDIVGHHRSGDVEITLIKEGQDPEPITRRNPGLIYGLANLVDNALDFATSRLKITIFWNEQSVRLDIQDDGPGFPTDILMRVGEPYLTTRKLQKMDNEGASSGLSGSGLSGSGLGLGLFIAKTFIERNGGRLTLTNVTHPEKGAVASIQWSREAFERIGQ